MAARADEAEPATDNALATLCGIVETSAKIEGLPVDFFTRLIWRESAFRTHAASPAGAMGVAQFMPGTASDRGLADPFDPATAIPASAKLLAELAGQFGNLGLAVAAYNAGPTALANWLAGKGTSFRDAGLRARHNGLRRGGMARRRAAGLRFLRARRDLPCRSRQAADRA
jgi:soluble lytic murein transglycosylase-like protein